MKCAECGNVAEHQCSGCRLVAYCCKQHQRTHWAQHKASCRPFEIVNDPVRGRCLRATRALQPGDLILSETPLAFGPRPQPVDEGGPVPCPGCCRLIVAEKSARCPSCDFPVCQVDCAGLKHPHIHGTECLLLRLREVTAINGLHDFYRQDCLLVLRCLLLQTQQPKRWTQLMQLEAHMDRRGDGTAIFDHVDQHVFDYLNDNFFAPLRIVEGRTGRTLLRDTSRKTVHRVCAILDINALEINESSPARELTAIYSTTALLEHSCLCNTRHAFTTTAANDGTTTDASGDDRNGYRVTVRASTPIAIGEHLSTMYTHALWGTQARRQHLLETKYFGCECVRCADPTELGTHLSALKCINSDGGASNGNSAAGSISCAGFLLPVRPLDDVASEWACTLCSARLEGVAAAALVNGIGDEVDHVQLTTPTVRALDALLARMLQLLHPHHYHVFAVQHSLVQLWGYESGYAHAQLTEPVLQRKRDTCRQLLRITAALDAADSRLPLHTAVLLHELHLSNAELLRRRSDAGIKPSSPRNAEVVRECCTCLDRARAILATMQGGERRAGPSAKMAHLVQSTREQFHKWLQRNNVVMETA